jgi:hypothetical protein
LISIFFIFLFLLIFTLIFIKNPILDDLKVRLDLSQPQKQSEIVVPSKGNERPSLEETVVIPEKDNENAKIRIENTKEKEKKSEKIRSKPPKENEKINPPTNPNISDSLKNKSPLEKIEDTN